MASLCQAGSHPRTISNELQSESKGMPLLSAVSESLQQCTFALERGQLELGEGYVDNKYTNLNHKYNFPFFILPEFDEPPTV